MIGLIGNYNHEGERVYSLESSAQYTLLDVIAYVYQKNLNVFQEVSPNENRIYRSHIFSLNGRAQTYPTINLFFKNHHYSVLLPETASQDEKRQAEYHEQHYLHLDELWQKQQAEENERALALLSNRYSTSQPSLDYNSDTDSDFSDTDEYISLPSSPISDPAAHEAADTLSHLDRSSINEFIDHRRRTIDGLSCGESRELALQYFVQQQADSLDTVERIKNVWG